MSVRNASRGSRANGRPEGGWYSYRGAGGAEAGHGPQAAGSRQPEVSERVLAALRSLGGEASTPEIRTALDFDGGPAFELVYLGRVLSMLARRDPPEVSCRGREQGGRAARWRLEPGGGS